MNGKKIDIEMVASNALREVYNQRAEIDDAVNWGSLCITEVGWYNDRWLIFVEEAAPDACRFGAVLYNAIKKRTEHPIQIITNW